VTLFYFIF